MKKIKFIVILTLLVFLTSCTSWGDTTLPPIYTLNLYVNETELYQTASVSAIDNFELPMYTTNDTTVYVGWENDMSIYAGQIELTSDLDLYLVEENVETVFVTSEAVDGLVIESYSGRSKYLKIPMYINDQQVRYIGNRAFEYSNLIEVMIPESVYSISPAAFNDSEDLEKISFYGEIESISSDIMTSAYFIEIMETYSDECSVINTEAGVTYYTDTCPIVSSKKVGETVIDDVEYYSLIVEKKDVYFLDLYTHEFAEYAFANLPSLTTFEMPNGWINFEESFYNTPLFTEISFPENDIYKVVDNVVYSADELILIYYPSGKMSKNFDMPQQVEEIASFAFSSNQYLETINLSAELDVLSSDSFKGMTNLKAFDASQNSNDYWTADGVLYRYGEQSDSQSVLIFYPINKAESTFVIPEGIQIIYPYAFFGNKVLENIIIPSTCEQIGEYAFSETEKIRTITIPSSVETIFWRAFEKSYIEVFIFERSITDGNVTNVMNIPQTGFPDSRIYVPDDSVDQYLNMFNTMSYMPSYLIDRVRSVFEYQTD